MGGMGHAMKVVNALGDAGLFRARDLKRNRVSPEWMPFFKTLFGYVPHGRGVWSRGDFNPTRYELIQCRVPRAVFWGPSALWLHGELLREPNHVWIAIDNKARPPRTLDSTVVVIRTRRLTEDLVTLRHHRSTLRAFSSIRSKSDVLEHCL